MSEVNEANKDIARRLVEDVWVGGDPIAAEELHADNYVLHHPSMDFHGLEALKHMISEIHTGIPDLLITVDDQTVDEGKVVTRWTLTGTHGGTYEGVPATGKKIETRGMRLDFIRDGKVVETWNSFDRLGFLEQVGHAPEPPQAE